MARRRANPHIGSSFDAFLAEKGILEDCEYQALKEMLADQVKEAMAKSGLSKTAMAARMATSRRQLDRLLDPHERSNGATSRARIASRTV
jgi:hypothetical protein